MKKTICLLSVCCALLGGCMGDILAPREDPSRFYITSAEKSAAAVSDFDGEVSVLLAPLPGYLARTQIATLSSDGSVDISEFNRWVEAPEGMFARTLEKCMVKNMPKATVYLYPVVMRQKGRKFCDVRVFVGDCIGALDGKLDFSARWITAVSGAEPQMHSFATSKQAGKGYAGYAAAVSECLAELSAEISKSIK